MYDYYEPLRSESSNGLFNLPFLVGAFEQDGKLVLLKCFTNTPLNPLVFELRNETPLADSVVASLASPLGDFDLTLIPLTAEYVLLNKEKYPFTEAQLTSLSTPGVLSLFAQAAIPTWYETQYPPPPELAEGVVTLAPPVSEAKTPEYRDVNGVLYERAADGSWVKAK